MQYLCVFVKAETEKLPKPEFVVNYGGIIVKFTVHEDIIRHNLEKVTEKVTEREKEVLQLIQIDPCYTYETMAKKLSVSRKTVASRIKNLKNKGIIKRIGSDTNGYWEILLK